jgi:hypothetical protein
MAKRKRAGKGSNAVIIGIVLMAVVCLGAVVSSLILFKQLEKERALSENANEDAKKVKWKLSERVEQYNELAAAVSGNEEEVGQPKAKAGTYPTLYEAIDGLRAAGLVLRNERNSLQDSVHSLNEDHKRALADKDQLEAQLNADLSKARADLKAREADLLAQMRERESDIDRLKAKNKELSEQASQVLLEAQTKEVQFRQRISVLENRLKTFQMERRKRKAHVSKIDGHILSAMNERNFVVLDIGQRERVRTGLRFRVYDPEKTGGDTDGKGMVQITRVAETTSVAEILSVADRFDPFVKGDALVSEIFSKNRKETYVVVGQFKSFSAEQIKKLIQESGGTVADTVTYQTDYLIVGGVYRGEAVNKAMQFGVEIIREDKFLALVGKD